MDCILQTEKLSKSYFNKKALKNVDLCIEKGKIIGMLGPNGSGKTTFLKIAAGILRQSKGKILIDSYRPGAYTKSMVSYLPDRNFLYKWMKIEDALQLYKDFYKDFDEKKAYELLDFMNLQKQLKITSLSKGMMEKLNLTLILARRAKLYIIDEPIAGVDPVARDKILDAIVNNYNEDSSMLISTHLVRDIERIFDDVVFISDGEVILQGNAEKLREEKNQSIDDLYKDIFKE